MSIPLLTPGATKHARLLIRHAEKVMKYKADVMTEAALAEMQAHIDALKANRAMVDLLGKIATAKKATPAQIALAWLLSQKPWIVPIPSTTKLHRLKENLGAVNVELTPNDLREIDEAASEIDVQGASYPEKLEAMTGR